MRRILTLDDHTDVCVDIYEPYIDDETDGHYRCKFNISGLSKEVSSFGMGVDEIQAIHITMNLVGNILYSCSEFRDGRLTWGCSIEGSDLGFPTGSWSTQG